MSLSPLKRDAEETAVEDIEVKKQKKKEFEEPKTGDMLKQSLYDRNEASKAIWWLANIQDSSSAKFVVRDYCQLTKDFNNILRYLAPSESAKRKILTCTAMEGILLILSDENDKDLATKFAQAVCLPDPLRNVALVLSVPHGFKCVLKLMTALIVSTPQIASLVISHFNWDQFKKHISVSAGKDSTVRSCLAYLILAMLIHAEDQNENAVSSAVTSKARCMFDIMFTHLGATVEEDPDLVALLIDTLLKKVAENSRLNKTAKMKLFNEENVERLLKLFSIPAAGELLETLASLIRQLFTDTKLGVVFFDSKFGSKEAQTANSNILATKIISFFVAQQNGVLLSLLVEILSALPDQIPHYFNQLKSHSKSSEIMKANAAVLSQLPPVVSLIPPKSFSNDAVLLSLLTTLCLPQSSVFLEQARVACKISHKHSLSNAAAPVSFLSAVLQRCATVFSSSITNQKVLHIFFWRVKQHLVDPDKVYSLSLSAVKMLKTSDNSSELERKQVALTLHSCLLYLTAYCRFSTLLMFSFDFKTFIPELEKLASEKEFKKLRKSVARLATALGYMDRFQPPDENNLLSWIVDETISTAGQNVLYLSRAFLKLTDVKISEGRVALIALFLIQNSENPRHNLLTLYRALQRAKSRKTESKALVAFLKHLPPTSLAFSSLFLVGANFPDDKSLEDPIAKLMMLVQRGNDSTEDMQYALDKVFSPVNNGPPSLSDTMSCCLFQWLIKISGEPNISSTSLETCLSLLTQLNNRAVANFLRALISFENGKLITLAEICQNKNKNSSLNKTIHNICAFIRANPTSPAVCLARQISREYNDSLCRLEGKAAIKYVISVVHQDKLFEDIDTMSTFDYLVSLCHDSAEISNLAKIVKKKSKNEQDISRATKIMDTFFRELSCRGSFDQVDPTFIEFCRTVCFENEDISVEIFEQGARLLYNILAYQPSYKSRFLRDLLTTASLKSFKHLCECCIHYYNGNNVEFAKVASFLTECFQNNSNFKFKSCCEEFELIICLQNLLEQDSAANMTLSRDGVKCLISQDDQNANLPVLMKFLNRANFSLCNQTDLLAVINLLGSISSPDQIDCHIAVNAIRNCFKSVKRSLSEYHQSFLSILSSLLNWSGTNWETLSCIIDLCAPLDIGEMKARHKSRLIELLIKSCNDYQGLDKWMVSAYVTPMLVQSAYTASELITNEVTSLIDNVESLFLDDSGNPHDFLIRAIKLDQPDDTKTIMILRCLHSLLWFRGSEWRSYDTLWRGLVPILLANYTATMSERDQILLSCLATFDNCFDEFYPRRPLWPHYQPCSWGPDKKLSNKPASFSPTAFRQNADQVLECLSSQKLLQSALSIPFTRSLHEVERGIFVKNTDGSEIYDPAFLVPVFSRTLATDNWPLNVPKFVSCNVLSYILASLSLQDDRLRALAYSALVGLETYARKMPKPSRPLLDFFDLLRSSIPEPNAVIAPIMASLLARLPSVIFGHQITSGMLKPFNEYVRSNSTLDLTVLSRPSIPRNIFTSLYYTVDLENAKVQRQFLADVFSASVRDENAFHSYQGGFNILPAMCAVLNSPLCSSPVEYLQILKIISGIAKSSDSARQRLVKTHRLHLLAPTFGVNSRILESGPYSFAKKNKAAAKEHTSFLCRSFNQLGIYFPTINLRTPDLR